MLSSFSGELEDTQLSEDGETEPDPLNRTVVEPNRTVVEPNQMLFQLLGKRAAVGLIIAAH